MILLRRLFLIILISISVVSCASFNYGYQQQEMSKKGWIWLKSDYRLKDTVMQRIDEERNCSAAASTLRRLGYPDAYRTTDLWDFYYAYVGEGAIFHFTGNIYGSCTTYTYSKGNFPDDVPRWLLDKLAPPKVDSVRESGFERPPDV